MDLKRRSIKLLAVAWQQHHPDSSPASAAQATSPDAGINARPSANRSAPLSRAP